MESAAQAAADTKTPACRACSTPHYPPIPATKVIEFERGQIVAKMDKLNV
jgi:hypothetical protein